MITLILSLTGWAQLARVVRKGLQPAVLVIIQALLVGAMVAIAGGIGFVGLVIPHLARMMVGSLHLRLLPIAAVLFAGLSGIVSMLSPGGHTRS